MRGTITWLDLTEEQYKRSTITSYSGGATWIKLDGKTYVIPGHPQEILGQFRGGYIVTAQEYKERRHQVVGCSFCDREKESGNLHHPSHDASRNCESNGYDHCTCDVCF